jgi:hypothetical protein
MKSYLVVDLPGPRFDGAIVERTIARGQTQIELLSVNSMEMTSETTLEGVGDNSCELRHRAACGQKGRHRSTEHRVPEL